VLLVVAFLFNKGKKHEPDYYTFFILGITWLPLGLVFGNNVFFIMGLVFMALGLANKDKWKKKPKWKDLSEKERKFRITFIIVLGLLFLVGVVLFFLIEKGLI